MASAEIPHTNVYKLVHSRAASINPPEYHTILHSTRMENQRIGVHYPMYISAEMFAMLKAFARAGSMSRADVMACDQRRLRALWLRGWVEIDHVTGTTVITTEGVTAHENWIHAQFFRTNHDAPLFNLELARARRRVQPTPVGLYAERPARAERRAPQLATVSSTARVRRKSGAA